MAQNTGNSHNTRRIAASWVGVAAALLATGALATVVAAGGSENPSQSPATENIDDTIVHVDDPYITCMRSAGGSPDTLEQWVDACTRAADAFEQRYLECLHEVGGSADTLERWAAPCRQQAASPQHP
jgi:hypothetical protein